MEPTSAVEAVDIVAGSDGDAKFLAGGTALVLLVRMRALNPDVLVSLRSVRDIDGWGEITRREGSLAIGGGVTLDRVARDPLVRRWAPSLAHAASVVGNTRIRNFATVGGLLAEADYASDPPAALVSLGASARLGDGRNERSMPVAEFISDFFTTELQPGEIVTGLDVPVETSGTSSVYLKFSSRSAEDRPCVGVAASGTFVAGAVHSLRVVVGAVSGRPQWFPDICEEFTGRPMSAADADSLADQYAQTIDPIDDVRGSGWYRREVTRAQVVRALRQIRPGGRSDESE